MMTKTQHPYRRTAIATLVGMFATLIAWMAPWATAQEQEFVAGSARSATKIIKVGPSAARLSLASTVGLTLSDYLGNRARAESRTFDFAGLQGTMEQTVPKNTQSDGGDPEQEGFDLPFTEWDERKGTGPFEIFPNLRIVSDEPDAAAGKEWKPAPGLEQAVSAKNDPLGRAAYRIEAFEVPGLLTVTGAQARSFAGLYVDGATKGEPTVRIAGGTVDIAKITILDGLVELRDVHWEAAQITDRNDDTKPESRGGFFIGRVKILGESHEGIDAAEAKALFDQYNQNIGSQLGILLEPPELTLKSGIVNLSPLAIRVASDVAQAVYDGINTSPPCGADDENPDAACWQQLRNRIVRECKAAEGGGEGSGGGASTGGLLGRVDSGGAVLATHGGDHERFDEFDSDGPGGNPEPTQRQDAKPPSGGSSCGVPILVADLAIAPFTGAGRLDIELGGVFGTTEGQFYDNPFAGGFGGFEGGTVNAPGISGGRVFEGTTGGTGAVVAGNRVTAPTTPPDLGTPTAGDESSFAGGSQVAAPQEVSLATSPASAVWGIGLAGLALAGGMAAADYRALRARRRAVRPIS